MKCSLINVASFLHGKHVFPPPLPPTQTRHVSYICHTMQLLLVLICTITQPYWPCGECEQSSEWESFHVSASVMTTNQIGLERQVLWGRYLKVL